MSRFAKTLVFAGLWLISLFLVGYLARRPSPYLAPRSSPEKAANRRSSEDGLETAPMSERLRGLLDLQAENEELRREMERLVAQLAKRQETKTASKETINRRLDYWLDRAVNFKGRTNELFLSNLEENIMFAVELAKSGDQGILFLLEFADEPERWKQALSFLPFLPSRVGLEAIMSDQWAEEGQSQPNWDWDDVKWHIEDLPTADLEPFLDTFGGRLRASAEIAQLTDTELYICAQLALRHQHGPSTEFLANAWGRLDPKAKYAATQEGVLFRARRRGRVRWRVLRGRSRALSVGHDLGG
jgi:hypothetical protein